MTASGMLLALARILAPYPEEDGVFLAPMPSSSNQDVERQLRERVAAQRYDDYLATIANHHSVPVMDHEIDRFLDAMPPNAVILDVGGCWGWHWRRLGRTRPDVSVLILDFVRANLAHAKHVLGPLVGSNVALMHGDATALPFPRVGDGATPFQGVWSVQVLQHVPDFDKACREAARVLAPGGRFASYSLAPTPANRLVYRLFGRRFHMEGLLNGEYHLTRANERQRRTVQEIFGNVRVRHTECLFHPDLRVTFSGRRGSVIGWLDAHLANLPFLPRLIARQRSFEATRF